MEKLYLLFVCILSINAQNLRNLTKRIYVGTSVNSLYLNDPQYLAMTGEQFNMGVVEWELKWAHVEPSQGVYTYELGDSCIKYALQHNMTLRGHTLVWHYEVPKWVYSLNKTALKAAVDNRIKNEMIRYKGKMYAWDVVNEVLADNGSLRNSIFLQNLGDSYIADAFRLARKTDPSAKLYINEYDVEWFNTKSNGLYNLVKKLKAEGVPVDGVGFQCHFTVGGVPPNFVQNLKRFTDLGVEVAITELDIKFKGNLAKQAADYAKVYKACQEVEKCVGVIVWGWADKYSYAAESKPDLWDENVKPKPAVAAVQAVLKNGK